MEDLDSYEKKPGMYPYRRPEGDYILIGDDETVARMHILDNLFEPVVLLKSGQVKVNELLFDLGEKTCEDRIPVLFYGSKVNPVDIYNCLAEHGASTVVPSYNGKTRGFDVVHAAYVSKAGSIPAHIVHSDDTETETWLHLLDEEQILAVHDSEKLSEGNYFLGRMGFHFRHGQEITAYAYFGDKKPTYIENGSPVTLASSSYEGLSRGIRPGFGFVPVNAFNRKYPESTQKEMLELFDGEVLMSHGGGLLHTRPGKLSEWGKANLDKANKIITERFGGHLTLEVERVENYSETSSLKRLKDLV